jgi:predicted dehydrogenase
MNRKLRMGMVGGGQGAFIGGVHRAAALMDGKIELVAGAFSSDAKRSRASGQELFIDPKRVYGDYATMAREEAALPTDQRIDFVSIVTPNSSHFAIASTFLKAGINVICDKPMTFDLKQARQLRTIVQKSGKVFALTHNYTGYPMVKQARAMVAKKQLGKILKIVVEYPQGWLLDSIEKTGQKQAAWRTDPKQAGASLCIGDIGTHAENLARYITGLEIESVCAEFTSYGAGRTLEDDANLLVRYKGGAKGILFASQISAGEENGLNIRVYGEKGGLEWHQEEPNSLIVKSNSKPRQIYTRGNAYLAPESLAASRLPPGHPEAFLEAFANVYLEAAKAIADEVSGRKIKRYDFPNADDGVYGMAFIETAVKSAQANQKWTKMPKA